ncbi:MAG: hypothetical protein LUI87_07225 [Lachnospiraceae bacterium]|nr:hypothetical protein [Lachnospiraceae bacterium]
MRLDLQKIFKKRYPEKICKKDSQKIYKMNDKEINNRAAKWFYSFISKNLPAGLTANEGGKLSWTS